MQNPKKPENTPKNAEVGSLLERIDTLIVTPDAPAGHRRALELLVEARAELERLTIENDAFRELVASIEQEVESDLDYGHWGAADSREEVKSQVRKHRRKEAARCAQAEAGES